MTDLFVTREEIEQQIASLSVEERQRIEAARERARAALAKIDPEAFKAKIAAAAKWEEEHGEISAFCGVVRESTKDSQQ